MSDPVWPREIPGIGSPTSTRRPVKCERCLRQLTLIRYGTLALCRLCAVGEAASAGATS